MKKFFIFIVPSALFIIQILFSLPQVTSWLGITALQTQLIIVFVIASFFIINQTWSVYLPFRRFDAFERTKLSFLDREFDGLFEKYRETGFDLRANVMLVKRTFLIRKEPKPKNSNRKKLSFLAKRFYFFWVSSNMHYHEDRNLSLTVNQGICGEAYRAGGIKTADLTVEAPATYNLCQEQLEQTKEVKFVLSCPICEMDFRDFRLKDKTIGVVNFDSRSEGSEVLINNHDYLGDLTSRIQAFSNLCSQII